MRRGAAPGPRRGPGPYSSLESVFAVSSAVLLGAVLLGAALLGADLDLAAEGAARLAAARGFGFSGFAWVSGTAAVSGPAWLGPGAGEGAEDGAGDGAGAGGCAGGWTRGWVWSNGDSPPACPLATR